MNFTVLPWDTDFFNFKVARVTGGSLHEDVLRELFESDVKLAYFSSEQETELTSNDQYEIKLVDKKLTYRKVIADAKADDNILPYEKDDPEEALLQLAVRSGLYSRFNVDKGIGNEKFESLYRQWMIQSVDKKMADEVFVHYEAGVAAGFVTVGHKNERADIGIIAVDESFSRRGIGAALMKTAEHYAAERYAVIQVVTQGNNMAACKLYERCGYHVEKVEYFYHLWRK